MQSRDTNVVNVPSQNENPVIDMINDVFGMNKKDDVDYDAQEGPSEFDLKIEEFPYSFPSLSQG